MKGFVFGLFSQFGKVDVNSIEANDLLTTITWMWMLHNKMLMKQLLWETDTTITHFHSEYLLKYQTTSYHRPCIFKPITRFKILNVTEWLQKIKNKNKNKLLPEFFFQYSSNTFPTCGLLNGYMDEGIYESLNVFSIYFSLLTVCTLVFCFILE